MKVDDVAKYVIFYATQKGWTVSNLKLNLFLYFLWIDYYIEKSKYLFSEKFSAWKCCPVQVGVYFDYYMYGAAPIVGMGSRCYEPKIDEDTRNFIDKTIDKYKDESVYDLVERTHRPCGAWDRTFQGGAGNNKLISFEDVIDDIMGEKYNK